MHAKYFTKILLFYLRPILTEFMLNANPRQIEAVARTDTNLEPSINDAELGHLVSFNTLYIVAIDPLRLAPR